MKKKVGVTCKKKQRNSKIRQTEIKENTKKTKSRKEDGKEA